MLLQQTWHEEIGTFLATTTQSEAVGVIAAVTVHRERFRQ